MYNTLINALGKASRIDEMKSSGINPDVFTFNTLIEVHSKAGRQKMHISCTPNHVTDTTLDFLGKEIEKMRYQKASMVRTQTRSEPRVLYHGLHFCQKSNSGLEFTKFGELSLSLCSLGKPDRNSMETLRLQTNSDTSGGAAAAAAAMTFERFVEIHKIGFDHWAISFLLKNVNLDLQMGDRNLDPDFSSTIAIKMNYNPRVSEVCMKQSSKLKMLELNNNNNNNKAFSH
ncbi:hypothetical protein DVH24_005321 [Malus domestica]|uniref:Uncharacterized protein n=1 Tax=Malus domestica TaxID=3750 RepID=A0A498KIL8_MALDO|nr:hypothetical protein DVH24_005321 [Malus domestica]